MLKFSTAGESHGQALLALLSGLPAGIPLDADFVRHELWRRQQGYGRGGRMRIEKDTPEFLSGVRNGATIGSPIAIQIANHDWKNWEQTLAVEAPAGEAARPVTSPRPGHADLAGAIKFNFPEARYVLERASARETAARVGLGAMAKLLLRQLGIEVLSHVTAVGAAALAPDFPVTREALAALAVRDTILLHCLDDTAEQRMKEEVDKVLRSGDTVGGVFEVRAFGLPIGLGTCANWDERLDGRLAQAVMSIQAVKAVEIGEGMSVATAPGSLAQDPIGYDPAARQFTREGNHAGGLEGGITNGQELIVRGYLKPISTLRRPLASVDFATREPVKAAYERSDVCVVPAAAVVAESMVALILASAVIEKFGGDSLTELRRNYNQYQDQVRQY